MIGTDNLFLIQMSLFYCWLERGTVKFQCPAQELQQACTDPGQNINPISPMVNSSFFPNQQIKTAQYTNWEPLISLFKNLHQQLWRRQSFLLKNVKLKNFQHIHVTTRRRAPLKYLTIKPVALLGYRSIAHEAKPNGLLTRGPWGRRV